MFSSFCAPWIQAGWVITAQQEVFLIWLTYCICVVTSEFLHAWLKTTIFVELQIQVNVEWKVKQISEFLYFHIKIGWNLSEKCGKVLYLKNCDVWESCIFYRQFSSERSCRFGRWLLKPGLVLIQVMVSGTGKLHQLFTSMQSDGLLRQHFTNWHFMNSWTWLLGIALRPDCRRLRVSWRTVNMNLLNVTGLELDLFVIILRGVFLLRFCLI